MPEPEIEPEPSPVMLALRVYMGGTFALTVKVAVTERAALIVTWQVPAPEQPQPLQLVKVELALAVALKVTTVPQTYQVAQVPTGHPLALHHTVPLPVPFFVTVSG
jgi:hypothetical protein